MIDPIEHTFFNFYGMDSCALKRCFEFYSVLCSAVIIDIVVKLVFEL